MLRHDPVKTNDIYKRTTEIKKRTTEFYLCVPHLFSVALCDHEHITYNLDLNNPKMLLISE